jgi:hypothetical protein
MSYGKPNNKNSQKYEYGMISDKGRERSEYTSIRFQNEVLYLETSSERYEVMFNKIDKYSFSMMKRDKLLTGEEMEKCGVPLGDDLKMIIYSGLLWSDFVWGYNSLILKKKIYYLSNLKFYKIKI